jgi:glucosylceramidase
MRIPYEPLKLGFAFFVLIVMTFPCQLQAQKKSKKVPINPESNNIESKKNLIYTTAKDTKYKLSEAGSLKWEAYKQPMENEVFVLVDPSKTFQTIYGIGGAITDASAETFHKLSKDKQKELLTAYFNKEKGIGYSLIRTNINSCDFSSASYTYVADHDTSLRTFDVSHDKQFKIPMINEATASAGGTLPLFVSPWSPPAWMKDNNNMLLGGKLKPEFRQAWANYYIKFIQTYEAMNMPIWGLSVQNEPMAKQKWESCIFTAEDERDFIKEYLGPTLRKAGMGNKKLIAWDHNRDLIYQRASTILNDPDAAKYVWGIGFHWYETWTGGGMQFDNLRRVYETYPEKNLIFTEGCKEKFSLPNIHDWDLGEKYGYSLINDFNNGTTGWIDWNILLDETGGPNHVGNFCFAPVHADSRTGELIYTNAFYYLGHFSKFVRPDAKRIATSSNREKLLATAFKNADGKLSVVVMNMSSEKMNCKLIIDGKQAALESLPNSISTIVMDNL